MDIKELEKSVCYVRNIIKEKPDVAVILGSGLGELAQKQKIKSL